MEGKYVKAASGPGDYDRREESGHRVSRPMSKPQGWNHATGEVDWTPLKRWTPGRNEALFSVVELFGVAERRFHPGA